MTNITANLSRMLLCACVFLSSATCLVHAAELDHAELKTMRVQAQNFLLKDVQDNGALFPGDRFTLGITAVILGAVTDGPEALKADDPRVAKALTWLLSFQQPDGGIYDPKEGLGNYVTSLTLIALSNVGSGNTTAISKAQNYLLGIQNNDDSSKFSGGIGYGSKGAGHEDLNNTTYAITALRESGIAEDHPAMKKALAFVQHCQNLSATNDLPSSGNDGGGIYSPDVSKVKSFGSEEDKAQEQKEAAAGELKSYGTMTYNLIASYIYLNVSED
ncbi:MAG: terpene cyclase/mutase family protein, partial [Planctomycetes bacterium]|nr:terpene cyclase/mutase family protein [Planctomycetota bacterium]